MSDWLDRLVEQSALGEAAVLVTVASIKGSTPREPGAKMVVTRAAIAGTIGGGHLELKAIEIARHLLDGNDTAALHRFPLGAALGQCCGGLANLLIEPVPAGADWVAALAQHRARGEDCVTVALAHGAASADKLIVGAHAARGSLGDPALDAQAVGLARRLLNEREGACLRELSQGEQRVMAFFDPQRTPDFHIVLFGAGHVGRQLVNVLAPLPCRITWVDSRDEEFPARVPGNVTVALTDAPEAEVRAAPAGSYFLVMTHDHRLDQALAETILKRSDFAYFGLIGSASKRRQFEKRMAARGTPPARFADMTCPIGVPGIPGKEPAAIAIAVAAQLLQVRARTQQTSSEPSRLKQA